MTPRLCKLCKKEFMVKHPSSAKAFCSKGCESLKFGKSKCKECGKIFQRKTANHTLCSDDCRKSVADKLVNSGEGSGKVARYYRRRFEVLQRDNFACAYCGRSPRQNSGVRLCVDHIVPRSNGGDNSMDNLVTACEQCNLGKSDVMLEQHLIDKIKHTQ